MSIAELPLSIVVEKDHDLATVLSIERERAPDEHFAGCDRGRTIRILKQSVRTEPRCPFETDLATRRFT